MNLTDREILELNKLCGAVVDGTLTNAEKVRLTRWLAESEAARRYYVSALGQSASLYTYASEMHAEAPDSRPAGPNVYRVVFGWSAALAAAAAVVLGVWFLPRLGPRKALADPRVSGEFVARITASKNSQWAGVALKPGERLGINQRLELTAGLAEITFDSGACVVLEGPAVLEVNSAWDGTLRRGTLKASVPPEAIGFRISNPAVEVVDLGTEFTMIADGKGAAEVLVLKGEVEAAPRMTDEEDTILLRENESRRFANSGVSEVSDRDEKFARFTQPLTLDRYSRVVNYVHWSFDEAGGDRVNAEVAGASANAADVAFKIVDTGDLATAHTEGRVGRALRFDGHLEAKGYFPGISGSTPRTIAFWLKVPEDAQLSNAYAIVTWATNLKKLGNRPVGISWNRRPAEGPLGALRTDFGGGYAMSTTPLRDGKWHHVAVYFAPGDDPHVPVQVKQYIDGRLESSTIIRSQMHPMSGIGNTALVDYVWLGRRLTGKQPERFRGELDELFIADRGLEPSEIVSLINDNRLPVAGLAATP